MLGVTELDVEDVLIPEDSEQISGLDFIAKRSLIILLV